ncbi:MAG: pyridoxal-phosphate-dependent aminotransferase family protein [Candidatus Hodarchaeota archaeon]
MEPSKTKLYTPGPVFVSEETLKNMAAPGDTHRSGWYSELHKEVVERLKKVMYTENDVYIGTCSGSGFMEACVSNTLGPEDKGLFISIGAFGDRWIDMGKGYGKNYDTLKIEMGKAAKAEDVKKALEGNKYTTIFIQFNETSTGVKNPLYEIAPIVKDSGALLCVDAVSGLLGMKLEVDKLKIDACLASVQKCFAIPPGLAVCSVSEDMLEKSKNTPNKGYYFDLMVLKKYADRNQTPSTPPIPQIFAMNAQLDKILNEEGLENRFKRHDKLAQMTRDWATGKGFEMFSEEGYHSSTVSTMKNNLNKDVGSFVKKVEKKGYRIVNGYGKLKDKTFRIGHMGDLQESDMTELFGVLDETLKEI